MRRALWFGLASVAALFVASAPAFAQAATLKVNVPFPFVIEGRTLPAGAYEVMEKSPSLVEVRGTSGAPAALALVTRLAGRPESPAASAPDELIFDKVGTQNFLSEIWWKGEDGFLVAATKGPHTHTRVTASRK